MRILVYQVGTHHWATKQLDPVNVVGAIYRNQKGKRTTIHGDTVHSGRNGGW